MGHTVEQHVNDWHMLSQYTGKEVFIVAGGEDEETGDIDVFEDWEGLVEKLKTLSPTSDPETRVFHGVLTLGEFLPSSFHGKSAFIICFDPYEDKKGSITESTGDSSMGLAEEISNIMSLGGPISDMKINIDDIYILYGYQLDSCLSVNDEEIDEEIISTCNEIAAEIETAKTLIMNA
jgi:hypothetical protein